MLNPIQPRLGRTSKRAADPTLIEIRGACRAIRRTWPAKHPEHTKERATTAIRVIAIADLDA